MLAGVCGVHLSQGVCDMLVTVGCSAHWCQHSTPPWPQLTLPLSHDVPRRPASAGVLLQGLHISGCKGSAVLASGGLSAPQGVQWASLPAGLHLLDCTLAGNAAGVGGGVRVSRAALYLDSVEVSGNQAAQLGGGVSIEQGLLVAVKAVFRDNTAGSGGLM